MQKLFASLCLIFHVIEVVSDASKAGDISLLTAVQAAGWCENLEQHQAKVIGLARQSNPEAMLARRILKGDVTDGMTIRDIERKNWSGLRATNSIHTALTELENMQWLKVEEQHTGGRPKQVVRLNPKLGGKNV